MKEVVFKKDEVIFREGERGESMYLLVKGRAGVYVGYGTDQKTQLTVVGGGAVLGEMAVLEDAPRSATAVAVEDVTAMEVRGADLTDFLRERPEKALEIMTHMSHRLRALTDDYIAACGTIREMENPTVERSEGLVARIKKFIRDYDRSQMVVAQGYLNDSRLFY